MDYVFVLDVSGSMANDGKLLVSKDSVAAFLNELSETDRFEVMTFNVQPYLAFSQLQPATAANKQRALDYLSPTGSPRRHGAAARDGHGLQIRLRRPAAERRDPQRRHDRAAGAADAACSRSRPARATRASSASASATMSTARCWNNWRRTPAASRPSCRRSDNFARQARAFRQKLMRPFATGLEIKFAGVEVTDVEPATVPNLYFGAPVRVYGRYRGSGMAQVTLRGSVKGVEVKQAAQLEFPKTDPANPEINRMWAWHRIDALLKDADRKGDRAAVAPEIVRLGEDFSIVTEYTSFLVLENDAEYQRWKIARKNLDSTGRDRQVHAKLREQLDSIRNKALADLGPQAVAPADREVAGADGFRSASRESACAGACSAAAATIRPPTELGHPHARDRVEPGWPARRPGRALAGPPQEQGIVIERQGRRDALKRVPPWRVRPS